MSLATFRRTVALATLPALVALTACGGGSPKRSTTAPKAVNAFPLTLQSAQGPVRLPAQPRAIISLSPTATEDLFAIGAGPQVLAVDDQSNYPPSAPHTNLSGFKPNVEAIAARKPDLVVIADDSTSLSGALGKLGIPTLVEPAAKSLTDAYAQIDQLGAATGHAPQAGALEASMQNAISAAVAHAAHPSRPLRIYHELDQTFYTATSSTFIGQLYKLLGVSDIADAADSQGSGYPQLSAEYIVKADPDVIFLADTVCCAQTPATVAARPGWSSIAAVRNHAVVALNDDVASRWGPRVVQLVQAIAAGLALARP